MSRISSGPLNAKIWVVGEAPGKQEVKEGEPFTSYSGKFLKDKLRLYGCDLEDVRMDYLSKTMPKGGQFANFYANEDSKKQLFKDIAEIKELIKEGNPNVVLCLGAQPLKYLGEKTKVDDWRGHIIWSDELECKLLTTYHPSVAMRQRRVPKKSHPGQYETLFMYDVKKALIEAKIKKTTFDQYDTIINPSFDEAKSYLEGALRDANILSYDIETDSHSVMDCIGFCYERDLAICIPFHILTPDGLVPFWKVREQGVEILGLVKDLMESDIPKVAQNSQYDTVFMHKYYEIEVRNLMWDTMVAAHDLYSELPKDLGTLISLYSNVPYSKYLGKSESLSDHWEYNATDAIANLHIMHGQFKECDELGIMNHYKTIPHSAIMPCVWMQVEGVNVDEELRTEAISVEELLQETLLDALDSVFPVKINSDKKFMHKVNPGSSKDKLYVFDKTFGCKLHYKRNTKTNRNVITFDKKVMEDYMKDGRVSVRLISEAMRKYRISQTMLGKLKTPLLDGRMHCSYYLGGIDEDDGGKEVGTDTGRLNSKSSIFRVLNELGSMINCGTNLQNLQAGLQRQMLIPDEGEGFLYLDLWAAEAYITALDAGEPELLAMLNKGIKIHGWMLEETTKMFLKECKKFNFTYKKAKQIVHALNYGVEPGMMSRESGLPKAVCSWQYNMYHTKFPGIKLRQERIKNELITGRRIVSLLGRQKIVIAPMSDQVLKQAYAWPSQSVIGEITLLGMVKMHYFGRSPSYPWCFPALNTHDGLAVRYKLGEEEAVEKLATSAFNIPIVKGDLSITVPISIGWAKNFNDVEDERVIKYGY